MEADMQDTEPNVLEIIERFEARLQEQSVGIETLNQSLVETNAKVSAFESFADDLVGMSGLLVEQANQASSNTLANAELVIAQADTLTGVTLWILAGILSVVLIAIQLFFNVRDSDRRNRLIERITEDDEFINQATARVMANERFTETLENSIKNRVQSELDMQPDRSSKSENGNDF